MRIEDITESKLKTAKDNELYSLRSRCIHIWRKMVGEKIETHKKAVPKKVWSIED